MTRTAWIARSRWLGIVACLALSSPATGQAAGKRKPRPTIDGFWDAPGGRIKINLDADKVTGVLTEPVEGLGVPVGVKVLKGTIFEDSFAGDILLGVLAPDCKAAMETAYAMLLLTRSGKLTGGVASQNPCASQTQSVAMVKVTGASRKHVMVGPPPGQGAYDPRGRRKGNLPGDVTGLMNEGAAYLNEGNFEKARDMFKKAIKKDGALGEAFNGVGVTYYARNDYKKAITWYKKGLEASPGFGDLYYNLACAYALGGKKRMALRYLKLAAKKGFTEAEAMEKDSDLDSLRADPEFSRIRGMMGK